MDSIIYLFIIYVYIKLYIQTYLHTYCKTNSNVLGLGPSMIKSETLEMLYTLKINLTFHYIWSSMRHTPIYMHMLVYTIHMNISMPL